MKLPKHLTIAALSIALLSTALLIGNRLGFVWAGQDGFIDYPSITVGDAVYERGETIHARNEYITFELDDAVIHMDYDTIVELEDTRPEYATIDVIQGRILVEGPLTVKTRGLRTQLTGITTFIHYSWRDEIEFAGVGMGGEVFVYESGEEIYHHIQSKTPHSVVMHTLEYTHEWREGFDPMASSSAEFYETFLGE